MSAPSARPDGGVVAYRAVLRWGARLFRRELRQQLLVIVLVAVAVGAAVGIGSAVYAIAPSVEDATFGAASHRFTLDEVEPADIDATVRAAQRVFDDLEVIKRGQVSIAGRGDPIDVRVQDPAGTLGAPMLALRSGRYPDAGDEIAVSEVLVGALNIGVGSRLSMGDGEPSRVVGLVENPNNLDDEFILAHPEFGADAPSVTILVNAPDRQAEAFRGIGDGPIPVYAARGGASGLAAVAVLAMTEVTLVMVALIGAAAFVAVAQRRQRQLGVLAAIGATEKHLRLVTLTNGALVGATAALVGAAGGLLTWIAAAPAVGQMSGQRLDRFEIPWWLVAAVVVLAIATTTAAAWWPARLVSRIPITESLAGRRPRPRKARRSLVTAGGSLAFGLAALIVAGDITSPSANGIAVHNLVLVAAGVISIIVGVLFFSPFAVGALGRWSNRLPLTPRIAFRDMARYQSRSAAALAAVSLALGIPLAVTLAAASAQYGAEAGNLSDTQVILSAEPITNPVATQRTPAEQRQVDQQIQTLAASLGDASVIELLKVYDPTGAETQFGLETIRIDRPNTEDDGAPLFLATDGLLDALAIERPGPDIAVLTTQTGGLDFQGAYDSATGQYLPLPVTDMTVIGGTFTSLPSSLITAQEMRERGWSTVPAGWLLAIDTPLTNDQIGAVTVAARNLGLNVETRDNQRGLIQLRTGATAVGMALALGILAMTVGLLRSEATGDLRTLTAAGATSSVRRALTAFTAAGLAALGVGLGAISASVGLAAAANEVPTLPAVNLAAIAFGVPAIATIAGWLAAGREPDSIAGRQNG